MSKLTILEFAEDGVQWDRIVAEAEHSSVFQAWGWGEFKQRQGWLPQRILFRKWSGTALAGCQALVRRIFPGFTCAWIPGGPFSIQSHPLGAEVFEALGQHFRQAFSCDYLRLYLMRPKEPYLMQTLSKNMKPSPVRINSGRSAVVDLTSNEEEFLEQMTGKHRYYVRQGEKQSIRWEFGQSEELITDFSSLMAKMGKLKKKDYLAISSKTLKTLTCCYGSGARILVGYLNGRPVAGATLLILGKSAWYLHAASNLEGRRTNAAYAMVAEIGRRLRPEGVQEMDFGGLGPEGEKFKGLNHFKKGFGGKIINYAGEWEVGGFLGRLAGNMAAFFRSG